MEHSGEGEERVEREPVVYSTAPRIALHCDCDGGRIRNLSLYIVM